jgi:colanic acid biosynthesis glycosyl transferase WcaI
MVTQWFAPEPAFKGLPFAKALVGRGHEVQVLTGFPNYPGGKVYPGYRIRLIQRETIEGVSIIRVPLYPSHDLSVVGRILNYFSFAVSATLVGIIAVRKADVMYVYHPPATVSLPAMVISWFRRIPFVYDLEDLWPDTLKATDMVNSRFVLGLVSVWCKITYRFAARIVVLSPGFKETLVHRGVPESKIEVIYNWCEEDKITRGQRNQDMDGTLGSPGRFNVVFAGTMGKAQGLDTVLEAAVLLIGKIPNVQFVFVGGGVDTDRLKRIAEAKKLSNVLFLPRRPVSEIGMILAKADVLLVHLKKDPLFTITIPSKIQAYLAAGRPILVGVEGDAAELVKNARAGAAYDPASALSLANAVEEFYGMRSERLEEMRKNGQQFYETELSFSRGLERFERVFRNVFVQAHLCCPTIVCSAVPDALVKSKIEIVLSNVERC